MLGGLDHVTVITTKLLEHIELVCYQLMWNLSKMSSFLLTLGARYGARASHHVCCTMIAPILLIQNS